ncbi:MAG: hypothetical protein LCH62_16570, partial [Proteobacteria bacterium]|nr:hypothetical protein [Pseudomonadota bacterium]
MSLNRIVRKAALVADWAAGAALFVVFAALLAQTVMRYALRSPLSTSQEMAMIAFMWFVFWLAGTTISLRE